jgi:hypothetical protein
MIMSERLTTPITYTQRKLKAKSRGEEEGNMGGRENKGMVFWLAF